MSISIPSWAYTLAWARREPWIVNILQQGYPRFVLHPLVTKLGNLVIKNFVSNLPSESVSNAMVFCRRIAAERCASYVMENGKLRNVTETQNANRQQDQTQQSKLCTWSHTRMLSDPNILATSCRCLL